MGQAWGEGILVDSTFREEHQSYTGVRLLCEGVMTPPYSYPKKTRMPLSWSRRNSETFEMPFWGHNPNRLFARASVGTRDHFPGQS